MALIVEDGSIVAGAESFISVADASTYHTNRGNAAWAALASDTIREQALRRATDYMEQSYRLRWNGVLKNETQALSWPRGYVEKLTALASTLYYADTIVPVEVKNACAELALKASAAELLADTEQQVISETVGAISVTYDNRDTQVKRYRAIDAMLRLFLKGNGNSIDMVRV